MRNALKERRRVGGPPTSRNPSNIESAFQTFKKAKLRYAADVRQYRAGFRLLKQAAAVNSADADEWLGAAYDYGLGTKPT